VLGPSAGTGNIAVLARLAGAEVDTNEIDGRRRSLLSLRDSHVAQASSLSFHRQDAGAERVDNPLPADKRLRRHRNEPAVLGDRRSRAGASHGVRGAAISDQSSTFNQW